jgi:hypothetical protein
VRKVIHCRPVDIGQPLSAVDGVTEMWFDALEDARVTYSAWRNAVPADDAIGGEIGQIVVVVSRPRVLYDADDYGMPTARDSMSS